jgi:very-short-patch-repair endonuclease
MTDRKRPLATEHMIARSRELRRKMTFPERLLWGRLRDGRLAGLQFRRQHPVGPYVADYLCLSANVVIELDGRSHDGQADQDRQRQDYLERQGLRVIRFSNDSVLQNLTGVLEAIARVCKNAQPPASS